MPAHCREPGAEQVRPSHHAAAREETRRWQETEPAENRVPARGLEPADSPKITPHAARCPMLRARLRSRGENREDYAMLARSIPGLPAANCASRDKSTRSGGRWQWEKPRGTAASHRRDAARFESCHPNRRNRPVASPTMGDATNAWTFIQRFVATVDYGQQQGWVDDGQGRTCPGLRRGGGRSVPEAARHQLLASWRYFSEFRTGDELLLVDALRHRMATHGGTNRGTPSTPLDHVGVRLLPPISSDGKRAFLTFRWLYCLGALVDLSDARSREQFRETPHDRGGSKRPTLVMALFSLTPPSLLAAGRSTDYIGTNCLRQPRLRFTQAVNHRRSKWLGFPRDESSSTHQQDR